MIIKRRFRPLGKVLQRFGRGQINNYTHTTNMASRADVPPMWEEDVQQPLVWAEPDVNPEPADISTDVAPAPVQRRLAVQRAPQPAPVSGDPGPRRTPPDLLRIHEAHMQMLEEEGYRMPPSPWAQPVDPDTVSRLPSPPEVTTTKPVQRRAQTTPAPEPAPASRPANIPATPAPPTVSGRRRGRVIEEITPPVEGEEAPLSAPQTSAAPDDEAPAWETELETAEDRPDLFEALMSEGVVQRRYDPDLSEAEVFTPKFRPTPTETPEERPSTPAGSQASSTPSASTPNVQRSETSQRAERPEPTPPSTPTVIQGSASPARVQRELDDAENYYANDEADLPPSLVPAPGTTESELLDMLGLPPDTPVRGLNPAAAMPTSNTSPAQPGASSTSTPGVQRQSESPEASNTPANPTPSTSQQVNIPPTSPYKSQTTGEQIAPDDKPAAPTSLSNQTVMRQPEVSEAPDESDWSAEPSAVTDFTSFFEAAQTAVAGDNWQGDEPAEADVSDWSESANEPSGDSPRRTNPFPMSNPPAAMTSNSAPTRPNTPRVQRAEADEPEAFSEIEDTQPINLPFSSSAPPPEANTHSSPTPSSTPSVQRASQPVSEEAPGEPYPLMADPAFIAEYASAQEPGFGSESDDDESYSAEYTSQPSEVTPDTSRSTGSSSTPSVQRSESPRTESSQFETSDAHPPIGHYIEGLSESRGTAPTGQVSRAKTSDKTIGGDKLGGKIVPEGMSMDLPGKTTTDSVPGAVTAPISGKLDDAFKSGGKSGGNPAISGKTDTWGVPPPSATATASTVPVDEAVADNSSSPPDSSDEGSDEANPESESSSQTDVDKLARDVYNLLRDRLRVEQERRPRR